ncbi:cysteine proteinase [Lentinus brumalis]|uniref:Cysteine proteinase n=1 Tax=Lentinus brumalis TaxID=2498619 RepID=A0A371D0M6_9APHY|nr:cysteine proteinase [Polyporus brumalis]
MIKHKHKQTPQDLYREKKRREEEERDASLPPGLINHGNTCFMNSTLQGLIATRPLHDLVHFQTVPQSLQPAQGPSILAKRSPQLTNGHGRGGDDEMEWTEGMPLGDIFTTIMKKAWDIQDAKRRETMSPKEILTTIGRKYDQYLDFRQQDAHEFLRHMLDAMRMEELDIIKKRQPPPPKTKRKRASRKAGSVPAIPPLPSPSLPLPETPFPPPGSPRPDEDDAPPAEPKEEDKLESFVDMLFGGQLASILVCEKCKKVSVTYEDFNDLSLSIKPEDYVKRKRDRIKKIARKLRIRPPGSSAAHDNSNGSGSASGLFRASSVPASPVRRSSEVAANEEEAPTSVDPRRRSFDHPGEDDEAKDVVREMSRVGTSPSGLESAIVEDEETVVEEAAEEVKADIAENASKADGWTAVEAEPDEKGKEKKGDAWGKIARRISVSMKLSKTADRDRDSRPSSRASDRGRRPDIKDAIRVMRGGEPRSPRATSLARGATVQDPTLDVGDDAGLSSPVVPASPRINSPFAQGSRPSSSRRSSTNPFKHQHRHHHHDGTPSRSPVPLPKMSEEESEYLGRVLADVHPVTGNPLSILSQAFTATNAANGTVLATQALWAKLGHLPGIEECLRMFTAVEILDGENMVGCHRCWKIANGTYKPPVRENGDIVPHDDSDSESESVSDDSSGKSEQSAAKAPESIPLPKSPPGLSEPEDGGTVSSPDLSLSSARMSPASTSVVSTALTSSSSTSISSAPTTTAAPSSSPELSTVYMRKNSDTSPEAPTFGGLPIPQISTTEVDTSEGLPAPSPSAKGEPLHGTLSSTRAVIGLSLSDDSLLTPKGRRRGRLNAKKDGAEDSSTSSDDDFDDSASDTSAATSLSDGDASPSVSPRSSVEKLSELPSPSASPRLREKSPLRVQDQKIPRAKQVIQRRMYKRYLISTPPPILVIHLKRFQQTGKHHTVSFSGGFKKLDEFVSFPEYLDLAPFLAPKRAEFTPERTEREKGKHKQRERCMYRLYAVVVHIGNMLGGHYVAYTALPSSAPAPAATPAPETAAFDSEKALPPTPSLSTTDSRTSQTSEKREQRKWAYISDTVVRLTTLEEVLKAKAYICMYERV